MYSTFLTVSIENFFEKRLCELFEIFPRYRSVNSTEIGPRSSENTQYFVTITGVRRDGFSKFSSFPVPKRRVDVSAGWGIRKTGRLARRALRAAARNLHARDPPDGRPRRRAVDSEPSVAPLFARVRRDEKRPLSRQLAREPSPRHVHL